MEHVILDVDTGIDDALAIAYAVHSPELNILGITTSFGNVSEKEATRNTLQVLDVLNVESEILVIPGADKPLAGTHIKAKATSIHGEDGLGNSGLPLPERKPLPSEAADFIIEQVKQHPHQVTVIAVGPQTNIATAIKKDPDIVNLAKRVVIMGGAVTVPGNVTPHAEANIYADPEAASVLFKSGMPVTLVGLDVTMQTLLSSEQVSKWSNVKSAYNEFLQTICNYYIDAYHQFDSSLGGCALHDPLAVGVLIDPSFVKTVPMHVEVDLERGESLGNTHEVKQGMRNVDVCLEIDVDRFVSHFLQRIT
ncbi:nucleoside hydrolase [Halobacillus shinanisalinarum]|uniref:Nucleoside hydrolase n=1 Tax=Halobacillus shinanisalinarum TaxID=2932258 RepID=A0ABY4H2L9_9BACI|nr:nucleoside hydrolase [Halobacillus shinanisalinarum]UOQ94673.1 nucleoside hydrolase [Halobacillus shinanisalinarum]